MVLRDRQRLEKIAEYCEDILAAVARYGSSYDTFQSDRDFQHSVSFCILQIGELVEKAAFAQHMPLEYTLEDVFWAVL